MHSSAGLLHSRGSANRRPCLALLFQFCALGSRVQPLRWPFGLLRIFFTGIQGPSQAELGGAACCLARAHRLGFGDPLLYPLCLSALWHQFHLPGRILLARRRPRLACGPGLGLGATTMIFSRLLAWVRGKIEGLDEKDSAAARERLVEAVAASQSARATILIREFDELCSAILDVLKAAGMTSEQAAHMVRDSMHAICPKCGWVSSGKDLVSLWLMEAMGFERLAGALRRPAASRFARGVCPSGRCLSHTITVVWEPSLIATSEEEEEPSPA